MICDFACHYVALMEIVFNELCMKFTFGEIIEYNELCLIEHGTQYHVDKLVTTYMYLCNIIYTNGRIRWYFIRRYIIEIA